MRLSDYLASPNNTHKRQGNPAVTANALYKTENSFNCYLTANQAINLAQNLLMKARLLLDGGISDGAVQIWNEGESEVVRCGLTKARQGPRRAARKPQSK
jgi:hypothetical protein